MCEYPYFSAQIAGLENDVLQILGTDNNTAGEQYLDDILHLLKCETSGQFLKMMDPQSTNHHI